MYPKTPEDIYYFLLSSVDYGKSWEQVLSYISDSYYPDSCENIRVLDENT